jgi:hypothetical protein
MIDLFFFETTELAFYQKGKRLAIAGRSWLQNVWGLLPRNQIVQ